MKVYLQDVQHAGSAEQMYCLCKYVCLYVPADVRIETLPIRSRCFR